MPVARSRVSWRPKLDLAERAQQVLERLEAQEVERLVGDLELHLAVLAGPAGAGARAVRAGSSMVIWPSSTIFWTRLLEQLVHLLRRHVAEALHHLLEALVVEELALLERLLDGLLQILQGVLVPLAEGHVLRVEAALQQEVGESLEQILGADAEVLAGVLRVVDPLHEQLTFADGASRADELPAHLTASFSCTAGGSSAVRRPCLRPRSRALLFGGEAALFAAADAAMGVQAFQNELGGRRRAPHPVRWRSGPSALVFSIRP